MFIIFCLMICLVVVFAGVAPHRGGKKRGILGCRCVAVVADPGRVHRIHVLAMCLGVLLAQARMFSSVDDTRGVESHFVIFA